jgi:starvation-inducible DNA-binding protein
MDGKQNTKVVNVLKQVLADTFVIYFKTHSFHWNVEGPLFKSLHELFEEQYTELWQATDELAERIRALEAYAPDNFATVLKQAKLDEAGQTPDAEGMLKQLIDDHMTISANLQKQIQDVMDAGDELTADMLIARGQIHEKYAWMLRSTAK